MPPPNWQHEIRNAETVLTFAVRGGKNYLFGLTVATGSLLLLTYGIWIFIHGWLFNHEEVLAGGAILFLILVLALLFPLSLFDRLLIARTVYRLSPDALIVERKSLFGIRTQKFPRSEAAYVDKIQTPSRNSAIDDTWRTLLFHGNKTHPQSFAFDGYSREESDWLAPQICAWAAIPCRSESTVDDA